MEEEIPSTSREIKTDNKSFKKSCTIEEKEFVAEKIKPSEFPRFARFLGLQESKIDAVETDCKGNNYGFRETVYQMLVTWEQIKGCEATVEVLISGLNYIQRNDIVQDLFAGSQYGNHSAFKDLQKEIAVKQKKQFKNLMLPRSLWLMEKWLPLEELFVELSMKKKNKQGEEEDVPIDQKEIFDEIGNNIPRRILIEGHPGYGKTTLVTKFLSDWSRDEIYLKDKFELIFVIPLRTYKGDLESHLLRQCIEGKKREILQLITAIEDRILLLLDGFDECSEEIKDSLFPLISGEKYENMTVVVTCRTGLFNVESVPDDEMFPAGIKGFGKHLIWDERVQIKGISCEKRKEFIQKYFNVELKEVEEKLSNLSIKLNNFFECPLFLLLLAVLIQENKMESFESKTQLYKTISNFIINRNHDREKLLGNREELDVFCLRNEDQLNCRHLMIKFGCLCLDKIKKQSLIFEDDELIRCSCEDLTRDDMILKLGFLSKQISFFNREEKGHYEPIHRSFLEFFAAFYLSTLNENQMENEIKELLSKFGIWPKADQLLYQFLGGFLQSNAFKLFNALSDYKILISLFEDRFYPYNIEDVLLEIPQSESNLKSIENVSLGEWERIKYKYTLHDWYIWVLNNYQQRKLNEIILRIPEHLEIINGIRENVKINTIHFSLGKLKKDIRLPLKSVECRNLIIDSNIKFLNIFRKIISKFKEERVWLKIHYLFVHIYPHSPEDNYHSALYTFIDFSTKMIGSSSHSLHYLSLMNIPEELFVKMCPCLENLIIKEKIKYGLNISFSKQKADDTESLKKNCYSLLDTIAKSSLQSFYFQHYNCLPFPINHFTNPTQWKFLELNRKFKESDKLKSLSVEHFFCSNLILAENSFKSCQKVSELLSKCNDIKRLSCDERMICDLSNSSFITSWKGLQTIERLDLKIFGTIEDKKSLLNVLPLFKNLREIHFCNLMESQFLVEVVSRLPSLTKIPIYNGFHLQEFLEGLLNLKDSKTRKSITIDELEINFLRYRDFSSEDLIESLEKCLFKNIFRKIAFLTTVDLRRDPLEYFLSKSEYKISYECEEYSYFYYRGISKNFPGLKHKIYIALNTTN